MGCSGSKTEVKELGGKKESGGTKDGDGAKQKDVPSKEREKQEDAEAKPELISPASAHKDKETTTPVVTPPVATPPAATVLPPKEAGTPPTATPNAAAPKREASSSLPAAPAAGTAAPPPKQGGNPTMLPKQKALGSPDQQLAPAKGVKEGSLAPLAPSKKKMAELIEIDQADFKPKSRKGSRRKVDALQRRLEQGAPLLETPEQLEERMKKAEERRQREQEKRTEKAVKETQMIDLKREELRAMEEKKAEELRRILMNKTKVASNNRESTIDVVRIKNTDHHTHVHKARVASKQKESPVMGDLPPIGKCLLAPDNGDNNADTASPQQVPKLVTSPRTPASMSGLVSPEPLSPSKAHSSAEHAALAEPTAPV